MRVYLDTNVFNRPFDDQSQQRIVNEADAFLRIVEQVENGLLTLVISRVLKSEVRNMPDVVRRIRVRRYLQLATEYVPQSQEVRDLGGSIEAQAKLAPRDSLHIASAARGSAQYFLTCDDRVLRKAKKVEKLLAKEGHHLTLLNPVDFVKKLPKGAVL